MACRHCGTPLIVPEREPQPASMADSGGLGSTVKASEGDVPAPAPGPPGAGPYLPTTEVLEHVPGPAAAPAAAPGEGAMAQVVPTEAPPSRYVEKGVIGRGGMGEVVLCVDRNIRREIALKRILPRAAEDTAQRARFVEEAQVTGQLEHPNIVPVHELDRTPDGTLYFTMKLVKGQSLSQILRSARERPGWHSLNDMLQMFLKVCDGVGFAHARGVIHRDIKPANIMVGDFGEVLVMDWGIAKVLGRSASTSSASIPAIKPGGALPDGAVQTPTAAAKPAESSSSFGSTPFFSTERVGTSRTGGRVATSRAESGEAMTQPGAALGTPGYMSPEQAEGKLELVDQRSDIYSLGAMLYEILTLERHVEGETTIALLANTLKGKIIPPEQRAPQRNIPPELSAITMKCLARNRELRYPSVAQLKRDINVYLEGRSTTSASDAQAKARLKRLLLAVAAAAVVILAIAAILVFYIKSDRDAARAAEREATSELKKAQEKMGQLQGATLDAVEAQARQALRANDDGKRGEAEFRARLIVALADASPWGHYVLGVIAYDKKDAAAAKQHLKTALARDPNFKPARDLSMVIERQGTPTPPAK
ncbi:MAG: serine/threonine protein kinase [Planctomycetes bacterium]|nr:serine/threonine protein kinase [Planctomycetota bacterium]